MKDTILLYLWRSTISPSLLHQQSSQENLSTSTKYTCWIGYGLRMAMWNTAVVEQQVHGCYKCHHCLQSGHFYWIVAFIVLWYSQILSIVTGLFTICLLWQFFIRKFWLRTMEIMVYYKDSLWVTITTQGHLPVIWDCPWSFDAAHLPWQRLVDTFFGFLHWARFHSWGVHNL